MARLRDAGLPYNSIEVLVLGNLTNTGTQPLNLKGSWIIVPFSMGVHTQFEGVWKRQTQPNSYFKVFCWCAAPCPAFPEWPVFSRCWHACWGCVVSCWCSNCSRRRCSPG